MWTSVICVVCTFTNNIRLVASFLLYTKWQHTPGRATGWAAHFSE